jgi:hypothetical protein
MARSEPVARREVRLLFAFVLAMTLAGASDATIYAYTDAQGRIRITDIPERDGQVIVLPRVGVENPGAVSTSRRTSPVRSASASVSSSRRNPEEFRTYVQEAARTHRLSESLIYAVMRAESNFNPYAISHAGAQGLMQLIPSTARLVGVTNSFDARQNILGGARYLRMMLDRFGRLDLAIAAYNAGPVAVERYSGIPPYSETINYVPRVLRFYREFGGAGELMLASVTRSSSASPAVRAASRSSNARSASRSSVSAGAPPTIAKVTTPPMFYYRGPDGQIYISNIR